MQDRDRVHFTYIGGPTVLIEWEGLRLLTDPTFDPSGSEYITNAYTLSKTTGPAVDAAALERIDAVLLSHDHHFDNLDRAGRAFLPRAGQVITTMEGTKRLGGNSVGFSPWDHTAISVGNENVLTVTGTPARHGPANGNRGPVIGFLLQRAGTSGPTIYVSGDTVFFDGVSETLRRFPAIRFAILFMGAAKVPGLPSHLTFTAREAISVAEALPKAAIIPIHYEGWKHFTESRADIDGTFAGAGSRVVCYGFQVASGLSFRCNRRSVFSNIEAFTDIQLKYGAFRYNVYRGLTRLVDLPDGTTSCADERSPRT